jgi:hypothetical protein
MIYLQELEQFFIWQILEKNSPMLLAGEEEKEPF